MILNPPAPPTPGTVNDWVPIGIMAPASSYSSSSSSASKAAQDATTRCLG